MSTTNPVRGRLDAGFFRLVDRYVHDVLGDRKAALFADLPGTVVELGAGTGANMRYYPAGTRLIAVEPNPPMHGPLRDAASRHGVDLEIRAVGAEDTGLADGSIDAVVSTLVLCTVDDPAAVVAEVRRILRPGRPLPRPRTRRRPGREPARPAAARPAIRVAVGVRGLRPAPPHRRAAGRRRGFADVALERYRAGSVFLPVDEQVAGTLRR